MNKTHFCWSINKVQCSFNKFYVFKVVCSTKLMSCHEVSMFKHMYNNECFEVSVISCHFTMLILLMFSPSFSELTPNNLCSLTPSPLLYQTTVS